jgi:hypothetical protein
VVKGSALQEQVFGLRTDSGDVRRNHERMSLFTTIGKQNAADLDFVPDEEPQVLFSQSSFNLSVITNRTPLGAIDNLLQFLGE